ncbi:MAG: hypothetical protein QM640_12890, partial [Niabella sp.]
TMAATAGALILPGLSKAAKPVERVNLACIGIGNRGGEIIEAFAQTGLVKTFYWPVKVWSRLARHSL